MLLLGGMFLPLTKLPVLHGFSVVRLAASLINQTTPRPGSHSCEVAWGPVVRALFTPHEKFLVLGQLRPVEGVEPFLNKAANQVEMKSLISPLGEAGAGSTQTTVNESLPTLIEAVKSDLSSRWRCMLHWYLPAGSWDPLVSSHATCLTYTPPQT